MVGGVRMKDITIFFSFVATWLWLLYLTYKIGVEIDKLKQLEKDVDELKEYVDKKFKELRGD